MAFSVGKTFANASKRFALRASSKSSLPRCARSLLTVCRDPPTIRPFTRSMWFMCNPGPDAKSEVKSFMKPVPVTKTCGSCLHTENDQQLGDFLTEEIKFEKENSSTLPSIKGFNVETKGPNVTLTKQIENETITVTFSVNNTVDADEEEIEGAEQQEPQEAAQMVSKPPFLVEIHKGGSNTLGIQCSFPMEDMEGEENPEADLFDIEEIALHGGEWNDDTYTVSAAVMDGNLYDLLMSMLAERGVDRALAQKVVEFSTTYEHKQYINFLATLKSFTTST